MPLGAAPTEGGLPPLEDVESVRAGIRERLAKVRATFAVMSGKGGVGKSAVAVNLALALAQRGARVGLLDADLYGPSVAKMLGLRGQPVRVGASGLLPAPGPLELRVESMDFFLQGTEPLAFDGATGEHAPLRSVMEEMALADLLGGTLWGELEFLVIDLAPGADRLPSLCRLYSELAGALAVTIPTEVSLLAVERSIRRAHEARIPMLGLIENMGTAVCGACGRESSLFREAPVERMARELDVPVLARIPFDPALAAAADAGRPFVNHPGRPSQAARTFAELATRVAELLAPPVEASA